MYDKNMDRYNFSLFKKRSQEIEEWLKKEIGVLRTGRANPAMVENIHINYYGKKTPLKHIASISVLDARSLAIQPWDKEILATLEADIRLSGLGIEPIMEKNSLRLVFPELTQERRTSILKILKEKLEEAKISLRKTRDENWRDIQNKEKAGEITEDDKFRFKDELQKELEKAYEAFDNIAEKKEREIKQ